MTDDDELRFDGLWETTLRNRWNLLSGMAPEARAKDVARAAFKGALTDVVRVEQSSPNITWDRDELLSAILDAAECFAVILKAGWADQAHGINLAHRVNVLNAIIDRAAMADAAPKMERPDVTSLAVVLLARLDDFREACIKGGVVWPVYLTQARAALGNAIAGSASKEREHGR